jgi:hypothetical protein
MTKIILGVSLGSLVSLTGCGSVGTDPIASSSGTGSPGGAESASAVSISGSVQASNGAPLGGVAVCTELAHDYTEPSVNCATSASDGTWQLSGVSAKAQIEATFEMDGFEGTMRVFETATSDLALGGTNLIPLSGGNEFLGTPADSNLGRIEFYIDTDGNGPAAPVSVSLLDADGKTTLPVYPTNAANKAGSALRTHGGFVNLTSGDYMLVFQSDSNCTASGLYGFPLLDNPDVLPKAAALDVPVREGYTTTPIRVTCGSVAQ